MTTSCRLSSLSSIGPKGHFPNSYSSKQTRLLSEIDWKLFGFAIVTQLGLFGHLQVIFPTVVVVVVAASHSMATLPNLKRLQA